MPPPIVAGSRIYTVRYCTVITVYRIRVNQRLLSRFCEKYHPKYSMFIILSTIGRRPHSNDTPKKYTLNLYCIKNIVGLN